MVRREEADGVVSREDARMSTQNDTSLPQPDPTGSDGRHQGEAAGPEQREALARLEAMESQLETALPLVADAEAGLAAVRAMVEAMEPLMAAYDSTWVADQEAVAELDPPLAVLGEDTVWDLYGREHEVMTELLRLSARVLAPADEG